MSYTKPDVQVQAQIQEMTDSLMREIEQDKQAEAAAGEDFRGRPSVELRESDLWSSAGFASSAGMSAQAVRTEEPETSERDLLYKILSAQGVLLNEMQDMKAEIEDLKE